MALDVYWQHYHDSTHLGSLEITHELTELLYRFSQAAGVTADPYGKGRLHPAQWQRLMNMAPAAGYPVPLLAAIQARIPADQPAGMIVLLGE
ncbi:hypothetical protein EJV47_05935 [Hymenobacter gummosus]|uniref:Uncharacterized protein n=1 Tax=Hymenobacter gummosus TaxID=1776032 RepID=A0A431U761_9BACT|nr:hypothetical protein [Hymenobacter gummosus]RTQ52549.1 hypothetical protein EJV47_05935 [Hymenobacter gummosus]